MRAFFSYFNIVIRLLNFRHAAERQDFAIEHASPPYFPASTMIEPYTSLRLRAADSPAPGCDTIYADMR